MAIAAVSLRCGYGRSLSLLRLWPQSLFAVAIAAVSLRCGYGRKVSSLWLWPQSLFAVAMAAVSLRCGYGRSLSSLWLWPQSHSRQHRQATDTTGLLLDGTRQIVSDKKIRH